MITYKQALRGNVPLYERDKAEYWRKRNRLKKLAREVFFWGMLASIASCFFLSWWFSIPSLLLGFMLIVTMPDDFHKTREDLEG